MKRILKTLAVMAVIFAAVFLLFRTPDTQVSEMKAKYGGEASQFVEIGNGVTVHLRDEGPRDAPAIILLHGSNADLHTWEPWVEALKDEYRVIRFDQVGHGLTGPDPDADYSIGNFTADIGEVADKLGLESFVLGGSSMGGGHAMAYALANPDRLDGVILVGASGAAKRGTSETSFVLKLAQTPVVNKVLEHITPRFTVEQSFEKMVSNKDVMTEEVIDRYWEMLRYPGNRAATVKRFSGTRTAFEAEKIAKLTTPTLIIWGAEDPVIPAVSGQWYDEHLPNSTLVEYPNIGHLPHEEAPQSVSDLKKWLINVPFSAEAP